MPLGRAALAMLLGLLLPPASLADVFPREDIITAPTWQRFSVCYDHGCSSLAVVALSEAQWEELRVLLLPLSASAAEERRRIAAGIALMEQYVGDAIGTSRDKGGTFNFGQEGQMDCIDESVNTTLYLTLFVRYGLMTHHQVANRATRGWFLFGWPHTTAVIRETAGKSLWAVDSWFLDNGEPPAILPLKRWKSGWKPGECMDCAQDASAPVH